MTIGFCTQRKYFGQVFDYTEINSRIKSMLDQKMKNNPDSVRLSSRRSLSGKVRFHYLLISTPEVSGVEILKIMFLNAKYLEIKELIRILQYEFIS